MKTYPKNRVTIFLTPFGGGKESIWTVETYSPARSHYQDAAGGLNRLAPELAPFKCTRHTSTLID